MGIIIFSGDRLVSRSTKRGTVRLASSMAEFDGSFVPSFVLSISSIVLSISPQYPPSLRPQPHPILQPTQPIPTVAHNHLPHHILTSYSLGASPDHLQATYDANLGMMAPLTERFESANLDDHDGKKEGGKSGVELVIGQDNWMDTDLLGIKE